ncbi:M48 family metallopeptidase [Microcoleus sp. FACHB-1515]|nr:M48 family metallopeptidase [Microcoleus sp. FACHB-1515]
MEIGGIPVQIVRKSIKNLNLSVRPPDGHVRVAVPWQMTDDQLCSIVTSRLNWIKKHQAAFRANPRFLQHELVTGESHAVFGKRYRLEVLDRPGRPKIIWNDNTLQLCVQPGTSAEKRAALLNQWYRDRLKAEIPDLLDLWQPKVNQQVADWGIKKMKTRWGSCNIHQRRIWLNLELAKYPIECVEYVLVHELVHLLERYHNDRFKAYMNQLLPHWRRCHKILNPKPLDLEAL